jgi:two-component sensor histidine kinase
MTTLTFTKLRIPHQTVVWASTGLLAANAGMLIFLPPSAARDLVIDLAQSLVGGFSIAALFFTALHLHVARPELFRPWIFLALGCMAWVEGDALRTLLKTTLEQDVFLGLADIFYLLYYPLVFTGLMAMPFQRANLRRSIQKWLDLMIVFLAVALLYWNFFLGPASLINPSGLLSFIASIAFPVFTLVLLAALMLLLYRRQEWMSLNAKLLLAASILIKILTDTIFRMEVVLDVYSLGPLVDLLWQGGLLTFGLAGIIQYNALKVDARQDAPNARVTAADRLGKWMAFLPYFWLAAVYGLLIYSETVALAMSYRLIIIALGIMLALILTRQVISIMDTIEISDKLRVELRRRQHAQEMLRKANDDLEDRVRQRTEDLTRANHRLQNEIKERRSAEERLASSLHDKEVLLKEIHHRVKNNLQVISSMLTLQANQVKDPALLVILADSQSRVQSMALIHEKLYQSTNLANLDFASYLESLITYLIRSYNPTQKDIQMRVEADPVKLTIDAAIPCGLIVNELVSNSLKHAFKKKDRGEIVVQLTAQKNNRVLLVVSDNGGGIPAGVDIKNHPSLGLQLVSALVSQLGGELSFDGRQGARFSISFTNKETE